MLDNKSQSHLVGVVSWTKRRLPVVSITMASTGKLVVPINTQVRGSTTVALVRIGR